MQRSWIQRPSVISALCAPIIDSAVERGGNREDLMGRFGLTAASIADLDHRVPITELLAGWTGAMQQTRAPDLPILVGKKATLALYGSLGYAIYTSRSSEESLQRLCRYHDVINNTGRWRIEVTGGRLRMLWRRDGERTLGMRAANEQLVASFATVARQTVGDATTFEEITYTHARPTDTSAHEAHFVCPIRWDAPEDSLNLPESFLALVPFGANKLLSSHFLEATDVLLARVAEDRSYATVVAHVISDLLCDGVPTSETVAARLGTSERTLRRRLASEDQRFEALLTVIQKEQSTARLRAGASVREAAFAAGFLDASSFARAFRRWTGKSPSEMRPNRDEPA